MSEPNILPEKDVFGLDKPNESSSTASDPARRNKNIRFAVILLIAAALIGIGIYFLRR